MGNVNCFIDNLEPISKGLDEEGIIMAIIGSWKLIKKKNNDIRLNIEAEEFVTTINKDKIMEITWNKYSLVFCSENNEDCNLLIGASAEKKKSKAPIILTRHVGNYYDYFNGLAFEGTVGDLSSPLPINIRGGPIPNSDKTNIAKLYKAFSNIIFSHYRKIACNLTNDEYQQIIDKYQDSLIFYSYEPEYLHKKQRKIILTKNKVIMPTSDSKTLPIFYRFLICHNNLKELPLLI